MRRAAALAAVLVMIVTTSALAQTPTARTVLRITGSGGQHAVLSVSTGGMRLGIPFLTTPRLPGPDGTISGVVIQRLPSRQFVGGLLLQNVPGFSEAVEQGLGVSDSIQLDGGRYALTLLGSGPQDVALDLPRKSSIVLKTRGSARPITRVGYAATETAHKWSEPIEITPSDGLLVLGRGAGGEQQQAAVEQSCFRRAPADGLCLAPDSSSTMTSPGAGWAAFWGSQMYGTGPEQAGDYLYSGRVAAVGAPSMAAHSTVMITLPR